MDQIYLYFHYLAEVKRASKTYSCFKQQGSSNASFYHVFALKQVGDQLNNLPRSFKAKTLMLRSTPCKYAYSSCLGDHGVVTAL